MIITSILHSALALASGSAITFTLGKKLKNRMEQQSRFKIRIGQRMPSIGHPVIVTGISPGVSGITFIESYVFLPIPKEIIGRKARVTVPVYGSDNTPEIEVDFDELIFDQARVDYELYVADKLPDIYREVFNRRQAWEDYSECNNAILRYRMHGLFEREIRGVAETAKCRELREHFQNVLITQPIRIEPLEADPQ